MKTLKRILFISITLVAVVVLFVVFGSTSYATEIVDSGFCGSNGDNVSWSLDEAGVLRITGNGKIQAPTVNGNSWTDYYVAYIIVEDGVTGIGKYAFANCDVEQIELPDTIQTIDIGAFQNCKELKEIAIPKAVKVIPSFCFDGCSSLSNMILQEGITTINEYAFRNCKNLISIQLPNSIEEKLGHGVFEGCSSISEIDLPENVDSTMYLFKDCSSLKSIYVGKGYRGNGGNYNFIGTVSLENIYYKGTIEDYFAAEIRFSEFMSSNTITATPKNFYLLNSTGEYYKLTDLVIVENISRIPNDSFEGYSGLKSVTLGPSVSTIGNGAFAYCKNLTSVDLSEGLKRIGNAAFAHTNIDELKIPFSVNLIDSSYSVYSVYRLIVYNQSYGHKFAIDNGLLFLINEDEVKAEKLMLLETELNLALDDTYKLEVLITPESTLNKTILWHSDNADVVYVSKTGSIIARGIGVATITATTVYGLTAKCIVTVTHKHDWRDSIVIKVATCKSTGVRTYTCSVCGDTYTETVEIDSTNHTGGTENRNAVVADCENDGYTGDTYCLGCNTKIAVGSIIPATGHKYTAVDISPTCTENGFTTYTCICGDSYIDDYVDIIEHKYSARKRNDPTCTEDGFIEYCCDICETEKYTEIILATGHKEEIIFGKSATCTSEGFTDGKKCSVCKEILEAQEKIPSTGHTEEVIAGKSATCTASGLTEGKKCSVCGEILVKQKEISAKGHDYKNVVTAPTCTEKGFTTYTCDCGLSFRDNYINPTGHTYSKEVIAPTCTEKGYTIYSCACGFNDKLDYVNATGHTYSKEVVAPTCTEKGYTIYSCACGFSDRLDYVNATGHTPGSWEVVVEAQVGVEGKEQQKCTVCGEVIDERVIPALPDVSYMTGDANGDGKITAADARIALRVSARVDKLEDYNLTVAAIDVTSDGKITAADARKILRIAAKIE